jgi:hypothetical protein
MAVPRVVHSFWVPQQALPRRWSGRSSVCMALGLRWYTRARISVASSDFAWRLRRRQGTMKDQIGNTTGEERSSGVSR